MKIFKIINMLQIIWNLVKKSVALVYIIDKWAEENYKQLK